MRQNIFAATSTLAFDLIIKWVPQAKPNCYKIYHHSIVKKPHEECVLYISLRN